MDRNFLLVWSAIEHGYAYEVEWLEDQDEMDERVWELNDKSFSDFTIIEALEISVVYDFKDRYKEE